MNYNQRRIDEIVRAKYRRVCAKNNSFKPDTNLADQPPGVIVDNNLSRRAYFHPCRKRRQGYIFNSTPEEFAKLDLRPISPYKLRLLQDRWLRGVLWQPLLITIRSATIDGSPAWEVLSNPDWEVASFLAEKGWRRLTVQALEETDSPATQEGLNMFRLGGLHNNLEGELWQQINIFKPRITF